MAVNEDPKTKAPPRPVVMMLYDNQGDWAKFIETSSPDINIQYFKDLVRYCAYLESEEDKTS